MFQLGDIVVNDAESRTNQPAQLFEFKLKLDDGRLRLKSLWTGFLSDTHLGVVGSDWGYRLATPSEIVKWRLAK